MEDSQETNTANYFLLLGAGIAVIAGCGLVSCTLAFIATLAFL